MIYFSIWKLSVYLHTATVHDVLHDTISQGKKYIDQEPSYLMRQICFLLFKAFERATKSQNPMTMTGSRSEYRFSRVEVK